MGNKCSLPCKSNKGKNDGYYSEVLESKHYPYSGKHRSHRSRGSHVGHRKHRKHRDEYEYDEWVPPPDLPPTPPGYYSRGCGCSRD